MRKINFCQKNFDKLFRSIILQIRSWRREILLSEKGKPVSTSHINSIQSDELIHVSKFEIRHKKYVHHRHQASCETRTWLRRKLEYCAQRRTLTDFDAPDGPQIAFLSQISCSRDFSKFSIFQKKIPNFRHHDHDLGPRITSATEFSGSSRAQNLKLHNFN